MDNQEFSVTEEKDETPGGKTLRFFIKGRVTAANADTLQRMFNDRFADWRGDIVVNMRHVQFLGSGGIRVLLIFHRWAENRGSRFLIERPSESVRNVLGMTALDKLLLK